MAPPLSRRARRQPAASAGAEGRVPRHPAAAGSTQRDVSRDPGALHPRRRSRCRRRSACNRSPTASSGAARGSSASSQAVEGLTTRDSLFDFTTRRWRGDVSDRLCRGQAEAHARHHHRRICYSSSANTARTPKVTMPTPSLVHFFRRDQAVRPRGLSERGRLLARPDRRLPGGTGRARRARLHLRAARRGAVRDAVRSERSGRRCEGMRHRAGRAARHAISRAINDRRRQTARRA